MLLDNISPKDWEENDFTFQCRGWVTSKGQCEKKHKNALKTDKKLDGIAEKVLVKKATSKRCFRYYCSFNEIGFNN